MRGTQPSTHLSSHSPVWLLGLCPCSLQTKVKELVPVCSLAELPDCKALIPGDPQAGTATTARGERGALEEELELGCDTVGDAQGQALQYFIPVGRDALQFALCVSSWSPLSLSCA